MWEKIAAFDFCDFVTYVLAGMAFALCAYVGTYSF